MLRSVVNFVLAMAVISAAVLAGATLYILPGLPDIDTLKDVRMQVPLRIYTRDLSLISEFGEKRRKPVKIENVPRQFVDAFVAAEDDRFYQHPGVDWQGILRAFINLVRTGEKTQGGSTITMQVARNFFLSREKSYLRKLNEIFLALKIERELTKQEILELYVNKIYLGQRAYGIGAAAQVYYGLDVKELSIAQMAMIAGLPKAPSTTNPVSNPHRALLRRNYVLRRMLELGYITRKQFNKASIEPISASLHSPDIAINAPYISEMARTRLLGEYGEEAYSAGYRVITTINDRNQVAANQALRKALIEYDRRHGYRGPEQHFDLNPAHSDKDLKRLLQPFSSIGALYPAVVTEVRERSVTAYLGGIGNIDIEWEGLKWARKYVTENVRGREPDNAGEILKPGDIIRVVEDENGDWSLGQIPAVEGALVSMRPDDGATLALVGGFDYSRSKFNRAIQAKRQPGSSFKPFIYSAALEAGFTAASIINDAPVVFDDPGLEDTWRPENYSGEYFGPTRLREGLIHSRNLVSIRLLHAIGVPYALQHIAKFGFDTESLPHNLSLALGSGAVSPWRMASAYCIFANGGYRIDPYYIDRIETYDGRKVFKANPARVCSDCAPANDAGTPPTIAGEGTAPGSAAAVDTASAGPVIPDTQATTVKQPASSAPKVAPRVVNPQNIWIMDSMTRDVIAHGTGRRARVLNRTDLSGKTGTTNDQRDAWFAGFNPDIVTIAWVGFDNFSPLGNYETGARAALPMWIKYMRVALQDIPETIMPRPDGLVNVRIDSKTGKLANADDPNAMFEVFKVGTAPKQTQVGNKTPFDDQNPGKTPDQLF